VGLHVGEAEPQPRVDELRDGRDEREVQPGAVRHPRLRGERIEVAHDLRLAGGVTGMRDPHVAAPEPVVGDPSGEVAGDPPVRDGDGAARSLERPGAFDLAERIDELRQERLGFPVPGVALGQERRGRLDVLLREGAQLDAARTRRRPRRSPGL
jgi:hypothetical protein